MTEIDKTPIIFEKGIPKKNKFIQGILFTKILLVLPFVRSIIKRWLTHCHNAVSYTHLTLPTNREV